MASSASNSITPLVIPVIINETTHKALMDKKIGASQVATSSTDAAAYGDLYQWGRAADGHQIRTSSTTSTLSTTDVPGHANFILASDDWRSKQNTNLWQGVNGVNNPYPSGFRIPTDAELDAERASWSSQNSAGAYASPLKFTVAGYRYNGDGSVNYADSYGYYWSRTFLFAASKINSMNFTHEQNTLLSLIKTSSGMLLLMLSFSKVCSY